MQAINKQSGLELSLLDINMDAFQVFVGRQHRLSVELGGVQYDLMLNSDDHEEAGGPVAAAAGAHPGNQAALPSGQLLQELPSSALAEFDPWAWHRQSVALPEVSLAGPVELVLTQPTPLTLYLPNLAEAGPVRRLLLAPGASVTLRALRALSLRRAVDLGQLPGSYVAEAVASAQIGPEPGFEASPGIMYLAAELYRAATNASLSTKKGRSRHLLSFEVEPSGACLTVAAAPPYPGGQLPRLVARREDGEGGTLVLSLRPQPADPGRGAHSAAAPSPAASSAAGSSSGGGGGGGGGVAAAGGAGSPAVAVPPPTAGGWAWPLPLLPMQQWLPYESLLRSILAAHPFGGGLAGVMKAGIGLRLKQSSLRGVSLVKLELKLRGAAGLLAAGGVDATQVGLLDPAMLVGDEAGGGGGGEGGPSSSLEVWEAVVQVQEGQGGMEFVPVSVKRKHSYTSTLTLSPAGLAMAMGKGNRTDVDSLPGYDGSDLGLARGAA